MNASENSNENSGPILQFEAEQFAKSPAADNPAQEPFNIVVTVPAAIQVKMVDASALADYEIWVFIASILSNAAVGYLVAYFQAVDAKSSSTTYIGWTAFVFIILFAVTTITAFRKRASLSKKGRDIQLKTSSATTTQTT